MNINTAPNVVLGTGVVISASGKYLKYLLTHKWYVFIVGKKLKVPIWRLIIHDWTKFTYCEFYPYALTFFGPWKYDNRPQWLVDMFNAAWQHHQDCNPHHWQHWRDKSIDDMPETYVREMVADWIAMDKGKVLKVRGWYLRNKDKMVMSEVTRNLVCSLLDDYELGTRA